MDVVADARAVAGVVVVTEQLRVAARRERVEGHRDEVGDAAVGKLGRARPGDVEVAQRGPAQRGVGRAESAQHPLPGELGLAVRAHRSRRRLLRHEVHRRVAVDGCARREQETAHSLRAAGLEQRRHAADVLVPVEQRLLDRLADRLLGGEVQQPRHAVLAAEGAHRVGVLHPRLREGDVRGNVVPDAGRQVVEHDDAQATVGEGTDDVRADVPGAAGEQPDVARVAGHDRHPRRSCEAPAGQPLVGLDVLRPGALHDLVRAAAAAAPRSDGPTPRRAR